MKKRLVFPDVMTGKQIANILHRVKRMKWRKGYLKSSDAYCALGMLARLGGVRKEMLDNERTAGGPAAVYGPNDNANSKEELVEEFCKYGDNYPLRVGSWVRDMLARQKVRFGK